jgi:hypothetical protein
MSSRILITFFSRCKNRLSISDITLLSNSVILFSSHSLCSLITLRTTSCWEPINRRSSSEEEEEYEEEQQGEEEEEEKHEDVKRRGDTGTEDRGLGDERVGSTRAGATTF